LNEAVVASEAKCGSPNGDIAADEIAQTAHDDPVSCQRAPFSVHDVEQVALVP
jgi:hypothetical protein